jgi:hypothetical protein
MKLPSFRRIISSDYDEKYKELVETLAVSINQGIDSVYDALNKKLTLKNNILSTTKDVVLQVDQTGKPIQAAGLKLDFANKASVLFVGKADNLTNPNLYPTGVFVSWTQAADFIQINNVSGLQPGASYRLKIVVFGDEN